MTGEVRLRVLVTCSQTTACPSWCDRSPPEMATMVPFLLVPTWQYPVRRWGVFLHLIECGLACDCFCSGDPKNTVEVMLKARSYVVLNLPPEFLEMLVLGTFLLGIQPLYCEAQGSWSSHLIDSPAATWLLPSYERSQVSQPIHRMISSNKLLFWAIKFWVGFLHSNR